MCWVKIWAQLVRGPSQQQAFVLEWQGRENLGLLHSIQESAVIRIPSLVLKSLIALARHSRVYSGVISRASMKDQTMMDYSKGRYNVRTPDGGFVGRIDGDEFVRNGLSLLYRVVGDEL